MINKDSFHMPIFDDHVSNFCSSDSPSVKDSIRYSVIWARDRRCSILLLLCVGIAPWSKSGLLFHFKKSFCKIWLKRNFNVFRNVKAMRGDIDESGGDGEVHRLLNTAAVPGRMSGSKRKPNQRTVFKRRMMERAELALNAEETRTLPWKPKRFVEVTLQVEWLWCSADNASS